MPKKTPKSSGWRRRGNLFLLFFHQPSHSQHYFPLRISISIGGHPRQRKELFSTPNQTVLQNSLCRNEEQNALLLKPIPLLSLRISNLEGWLRCTLHSNSLPLSVRWIAKNPQHSDELAALKQIPTGSRYPYDPQLPATKLNPSAIYSSALPAIFLIFFSPHLHISINEAGKINTAMNKVNIKIYCGKGIHCTKLLQLILLPRGTSLTCTARAADQKYMINKRQTRKQIPISNFTILNP